MERQMFGDEIQETVAEIFQDKASVDKILGLENADDTLTLEDANRTAHELLAAHNSKNGSEFVQVGLSFCKIWGYQYTRTWYPNLPFWVWSARFDAYVAQNKTLQDYIKSLYQIN